MIMKTKKRITWFVRYFNVVTGAVVPHIYYETVDDLSSKVTAFLDDLRELIVVALTKIEQYSSSSEEKFRIEHIDSMSNCVHTLD